jgi:hypothetical protein
MGVVSCFAYIMMPISLKKWAFLIGTGIFGVYQDALCFVKLRSGRTPPHYLADGPWMVIFSAVLIRSSITPGVFRVLIN